MHDTPKVSGDYGDLPPGGPIYVEGSPTMPDTARTKTCHFCGFTAPRGFVRRWLGRERPVWVCASVRDCELRREPHDA